MIMWLWCYYKILDERVLLLGCDCIAVAGWTVARPDVLAQVMPRQDLQELIRTRARALAQAKSFCLSETQSCSGERGSPKWGRVRGLRHVAAWVAQSRNLAFERGVLSPRRVAARLSENPWISQGPPLTVSPKRELMAWARLARDFTTELFLSFFWAIHCMLGLVCFTLSMNCMNMLIRLVCMGWNVESTWVWHELSVRKLVIKVA